MKAKIIGPVKPGMILIETETGEQITIPRETNSRPCEGWPVWKDFEIEETP